VKDNVTKSKDSQAGQETDLEAGIFLSFSLRNLWLNMTIHQKTSQEDMLE
jgi:hypothetical protein